MNEMIYKIFIRHCRLQAQPHARCERLRLRAAREAQILRLESAAGFLPGNDFNTSSTVEAPLSWLECRRSLFVALVVSHMVLWTSFSEISY